MILQMYGIHRGNMAAMTVVHELACSHRPAAVLFQLRRSVPDDVLFLHCPEITTYRITGYSMFSYALAVLEAQVACWAIFAL